MTQTPDPTSLMPTVKQLSNGQIRAATEAAKDWVEDCWTELPDGRLTSLLNAVDVWMVIESTYDGGVVGFFEDER